MSSSSGLIRLSHFQDRNNCKECTCQAFCWACNRTRKNPLKASKRACGLPLPRPPTLTGGVAGAGGEHRFYITDARSSEKVVKSAKIEEIRLTILNNMLQFHPESAEQLAWGSSSARSAPVSTGDPTRPLGRRQRSIQTQIEVRDCESGAFSEILVNTVDRPGLLTDIVSVLKDVSLNVISAEVDTIGKNAVDTFNVTYHGEPLPPAMKELVMNALQYYLSQGDMEKQYSDSY
ncbi:hypothetical protein Ndes2526B_g05909 [Nannochloris sp. 'desiccata']